VKKRREIGNNLRYWTGGVVTRETPGWERKNVGYGSEGGEEELDESERSGRSFLF